MAASSTCLAWTTPPKRCGGWQRRRALQWGKPLVGITGSNGKTTTKEGRSRALLATRYRVSKSEGNLNNEFGLPLSLLRIDDEAEIGVLEMGMNHRGEIRRLAAIARPTVGVVTNVNAAHLEFFESVDEIALAKRELIESLGPQGVAVLNAGDERVREFAQVHPGCSRTFAVEAEADYQANETGVAGAAGHAFCAALDIAREAAARAKRGLTRLPCRAATTSPTSRRRSRWRACSESSRPSWSKPSPRSRRIACAASLSKRAA